MKIEPVSLEGSHVRLEPLAQSHHAGLCEVGLDPQIWKLVVHNIATPQQMREYIEQRQAALRNGTELAFATIDKRSGRVVGSTRFMNVDGPNRRVEIGGTFVARPWQRTVVNTEAKYLMLRHAFETWGCNRVELKTDLLNQQSRVAIQRIGAKEEGILRSHMVTWTGRIRDTVYYSIIAPEWPETRSMLERMLSDRG